MSFSSEASPHAAVLKDLHWTTAAPIPLDRNGPQAVAFRPFETAWVERPVLDLFAEIVATHPDNTACEDADTRLTFAEIWAAALRLATTIDGAVALGAPVGVLLPNQAAYAVAVLACLGAARPCVLIDRNYPPDRVGQVMRDARLSAIILRRSDIAEGFLLPAGTRAIELDSVLEGGATPGRMPAVPPAADTACFVVYTSGSTGAPKGIVLSQRAVLHRTLELVNAVHLRPDDKVLSLASPGTIGGLQQIFEVMLSGACLVKLDLQRLGLGQIMRTIAERRITMMFSTPAVWRSVSRLEGARELLASLRCIQSSGDALLRVDYDLIRAVVPDDCHVLSVYGATEAPALLQWFVASPPGDEAQIPAGYPLPGLDLAVLDEAGQPVADGEEGEFAIRSRVTSLGLWQRGKILPGALTPDPLSPELKIYHTGDLVRRRSDGLYVVLGRRDRQIKILGNRVELAEIETALRQVPGVLDAAAVARRGEGEPLLLGFVVPRQSGDAGMLDELRRHLDATLPSFMRPRRLLIIDSLPLLPGRKVDEEALLARAASGAEEANERATTGDFAASRHALELVDKAWRMATGRPPPGNSISFEQAGGDSLQLLQLIFELERLAERPLALEQFHGRLNSRQFAAALDSCLGREMEVLAADAPAIFLFPPAGGGDANLTGFRAACAARLPVRQVRYPDLRTLVLQKLNFRDIAAYAAHQIADLKPRGALILAGYSDGGDVAFEAARQLRASGRQVARLLILDTDSTGLSYPGAAPEVRGSGGSGPLPARTGGVRRLIERMLPGKSLRTPFGRALLHLALRLPLPLPQSVAFVAALRAFQIQFDVLHLNWLAGPPREQLDVPVVLFRSEERRPGAPNDLGWARRTSKLTVVPVSGDHTTMLADERGLAIAVAITKLALARSE